MVSLYLDPGPLAVFILRLIVPLTIFRFPLGGAVASLLLDWFDVLLIEFTSPNYGIFTGYNVVDKLLDTYYLIFEFYITTKWLGLEKITSSILFFIRFVGVSMFIFTDHKVVFLFFPNLFEFWYLFWSLRNKYFPWFILTTKRLLVILTLLLIPKMIQEFILHYMNLPLWEYVKEPTRRFINWKR